MFDKEWQGLVRCGPFSKAFQEGMIIWQPYM